MFSIKSFVLSAALAVCLISSASATAIERRQINVCPGVCPPVLLGGSVFGRPVPVYLIDPLQTDPTSRSLVCQYNLIELTTNLAGFTGPDTTACTYDGATGAITATGNPRGLCPATTIGAAACTVGV